MTTATTTHPPLSTPLGGALELTELHGAELQPGAAEPTAIEAVARETTAAEVAGAEVAGAEVAGAGLAGAGLVGAVRTAPRRLLRLEGALVLAASVAAYAHLGGGWLTIALLFLVPDLSLLGYLAGPRVGAVVYNAGHSHLAPAALAALGLTIGGAPLVLGALIWFAHIGFDRLLGYGLKYGRAFGATHLGHVGRAPR